MEMLWIAFLCSVTTILQCLGKDILIDTDHNDVYEKQNYRITELVIKTKMKMDKHNRIKMGVADPLCDDGKTNLETDWDPNDSSAYTCDNSSMTWQNNSNVKELKELLKEINNQGGCAEGYENALNDSDSCYWLNEKIMSNADWFHETNISMPDHVCMSTHIEYKGEGPPMSGSHRPLWPRFGEYKYCPPQRWTHSLEHGALVMLYDPCSPEEDVLKLKAIVKGCLTKYVITPYKGMSQPFALITYGNRLMMNTISEDLAQLFITTTALRGPEALPDDGQYDEALIEGSMTKDTPVVDVDSLCPNWLIS